MVKNEDTYCIVQHKIVRELGAWEAVVYGTIVNLLRKTDGIGEVSNQTIMDLCGIKRASFFRYISTLIESGYIEKRSGDGRGNISIYYITKKGLNLIPFSGKKGSQNETERVSKMNEKGLNLIPINKDKIKEINKESSSFDKQKPKMEEEDRKIFSGDNNISELEKKAIEDVKNLFADDAKMIDKDVLDGFEEFWGLFDPEEKERFKYKVAKDEWCYTMPENCRAACLELMRRGAKPKEKNPYFFLQHFRETKYFLNEREQYQVYKNGGQLCRVRYKDQQRVMLAIYAEVFRMEILDDHYEKRFEN